MFCPHCGAEIRDDDAYCEKCGASVNPTKSTSFKDGFASNMSSDLKDASNFKSNNISPCSRLIAALLCWFLGGFGAHRFYTGKTTSAVFMLLFCWTFVPCIIAIVDFIMILCGTFKDSEGRDVKAI